MLVRLQKAGILSLLGKTKLVYLEGTCSLTGRETRVSAQASLDLQLTFACVFAKKCPSVHRIAEPINEQNCPIHHLLPITAKDLEST